MVSDVVKQPSYNIFIAGQLSSQDRYYLMGRMVLVRSLLHRYDKGTKREYVAITTNSHTEAWVIGFSYCYNGIYLPGYDSIFEDNYEPGVLSNRHRVNYIKVRKTPTSRTLKACVVSI